MHMEVLGSIRKIGRYPIKVSGPFAYGPLLQFLVSPNDYLKDDVCKFVVPFALDPVLVIVIEIVLYLTTNLKETWHILCVNFT